MLKVIWGNNRRLLAEELRRLLAAHQAESPYKRGFLLVPEQQKVGLERLYFREDPSRSLMLEEVLSFRRFALRIAETGGGGAKGRLSPGLQSFLLGRLIEENKDELKSFSAALFRPSFLGRISEAIGDFLRYEISPDDLYEVAAKTEAEGKPRLAQRFRDMALLSKAYEEKFQEMGALPGDLLPEDLNRRLRQLKLELNKVGGDWDRLPFPRSNFRFLKDTTVWIHGFGVSRSLTPQEYTAAALLESLCREVVITAESDRIPQSRADIRRGEACFKSGRELLFELANDFPHADFLEIKEERKKPAYYLQRFKAPFDELRWIAGEIKRLLAEEGVKPQEIGIALAKPELSHDMQLALRELDLPYHTTDNLQTAAGAFARFTKALSDFLRFGFEREYLLPLLRSPYLGLSLDEADMLDNFMLSRGLEFDRIWDDRRYAEVWRGLAVSADEEEEADEEAAEEDAADAAADMPAGETEAARCLKLRDKALGELKLLYDRTRNKQEASSFAREILEYFERSGFEEKVSEQQQELLAKGLTDEAEQEAKNWNQCIQLLAELMEYGKDAVLTTEDFLYYFEEAGKLSRISRIPAAGNQIILGSVNQLAQEECSYMFIAGAEQSALPGKGFPSGLLKTPERQAIDRHLQCLFPDTTEQRIYANASHLYSLLYLPESAVYMSYAGSPNKFSQAAEETGAELREHEAAFSLRDPLLAAPERAHDFICAKETAGLKLNEKDEADRQELLDYIAEDEKLSRLLRLEGKPFRELSDEGKLEISPELVAGALGRNITWSISRLERYASCPFKFFAAFVLRLEDRKIWLPEASDYGNLLHKVMEISQQQWQKTLWSLPDDAARRNYLQHLGEQLNFKDTDRLFREALREDPGLALFWEKGEVFGRRYKAMRAAVQTEQVLFDELAAGRVMWMPAMEEWAFGPEVNRPFSYRFEDGRELDFRGRIDRVDLAIVPGGRKWARMIDYKTGAKTVSYDALYHGLDLQLPIYLEAFEALNTEGFRAADAAYAPLNAAVYADDGKLPQEVPQQLVEKELKKALGMRNLALPYEQLCELRRHSFALALDYSENIKEGYFPAAPRNAGSSDPCRYCSYKTLCQLNRGKIRQKLLPKVGEIAVQKGLSEKSSGRKIDHFKALMDAMYSEDEEGAES